MKLIIILTSLLLLLSCGAEDYFWDRGACNAKDGRNCENDVDNRRSRDVSNVGEEGSGAAEVPYVDEFDRRLSTLEMKVDALDSAVAILSETLETEILAREAGDLESISLLTTLKVELGKIESQLSAVVSSSDISAAAVSYLSGKLVELQTLVELQASDLVSLWEALEESDELSVEYAEALSDLETAQAELADTVEEVRLGSIAKLIDPCGDHPGHFDEIIIKLGSGSMIAFFESSGKRFLTELVDGNYRTTDKQRCNFSISNGNYIE